MSSDDSILVAARFRPLSSPEVDSGVRQCVKCRAAPPSTVCNEVEVSAADDGVTHAFDFKRVFGTDATQKEVYDVIAKPIVEDVFHGYNGTVFAYGQTGSGKTHTMMGSGGHRYDVNEVSHSASPSAAVVAAEQHRGIIPRAVYDLFRLIDEADTNVSFEVTLTFFEIYMERIRDLIEANHVNLALREDIVNRCFYVDGLSCHSVTSPEEALRWIAIGTSNRAVASTRMNEMSSRSHTIMCLTVKSLDSLRGEQRTGKLFLVDLAGSEKVGKTRAEGLQLEEAKLINKSLTALGLVIATLSERKAQVGHVPYRDSKLTRVLQDSLGGNSKTSLIVCCAPGNNNDSETVSTLRFGARATNIRNRAIVNKDVSLEELKLLLAKAEEEIRSLKAMLSRGERLGPSSDVVPTSPSSESATSATPDMDMLALSVKLEQQQSLHNTEMTALNEAMEEVREQARWEAQRVVALRQVVQSCQEECNIWEAEHTKAMAEVHQLRRQTQRQDNALAVMRQGFQYLTEAFFGVDTDIQSLKTKLADAQLLAATRPITPPPPATSRGEASSASTAETVAAADPNRHRLAVLERQYNELEKHWKEIVNEAGGMRLELQLSEKRLGIRNERIEHLKFHLRNERTALQSAQDAHAAEKQRIVQENRGLKTEIAYLTMECERAKDTLKTLLEERVRVSFGSRNTAIDATLSSSPVHHDPTGNDTAGEGGGAAIEGGDGLDVARPSRFISRPSFRLRGGGGSATPPTSAAGRSPTRVDNS